MEYTDMTDEEYDALDESEGSEQKPCPAHWRTGE